MAHETLKALYEMDVEAFGREKANSFWEYLEDFAGHRTWCWLGDAPSWFINDRYRRRPDAPWPWEGRIKQLEAQLARKSEWPDYAPSWANAAIVQFLKEAPFACEVQDGHRLIKRPQPSKRKLDWGQLAPWCLPYLPASFNQAIAPDFNVIEDDFPSCWIPWNVPGCRNGMEGRECPVPDGVVVEVRSTFGETELFIMPSLDWSDFDGRGKITAFRITGIADGWE